MPTMELNLINVFLVLFFAHMVNLFSIWLIHFLLHQKFLGIPFYMIHLKAHHRIDYVANYRLDFLTYLEYTVWGLLTLVFLVSYYLFLPDWVAWVFIAEGSILAFFTHYVHDQYDSKKPWMIRYKWFVDSRKLHRTHHSYRIENDSDDSFMKARNYGFGGPLTINLADRLLGTFTTSRG